MEKISSDETTAKQKPVPGEEAQRASEETSSFADMRLKVGSQVHLDLAKAVAGGRAAAKVLGWYEGVSIMVSTPQNVAGRIRLFEGEGLLLRVFTGKSAYAFRTSVLKVALQPFQYFHLSFPEKINTVEIRSSPRCRVRMAAVVSVDGQAVGQGHIVNIGTTGAMIEMDTALNQDDRMVSIAWSFELHGVSVSLDLPAKVCGAKGDPTAGSTLVHQYGVAFDQLKPNDRLLLGSLVWYQMYEHPGSVS